MARWGTLRGKGRKPTISGNQQQTNKQTKTTQALWRKKETERKKTNTQEGGQACDHRLLKEERIYFALWSQKDVSIIVGKAWHSLNSRGWDKSGSLEITISTRQRGNWTRYKALNSKVCTVTSFLPQSHTSYTTPNSATSWEASLPAHGLLCFHSNYHMLSRLEVRNGRSVWEPLMLGLVPKEQVFSQECVMKGSLEHHMFTEG